MNASSLPNPHATRPPLTGSPNPSERNVPRQKDAVPDAGESIKALSEYLGHSDPGFTLRTYTHLLPSSETRTRKAIDDVFVFAEAEAEGGDDRPGTQGTSVPPAKPKCPQCALAA